MTHHEQCLGCLAEFEVEAASEIPHPYVGASSACWELFGHILAKEFSDPEYFKVHRITADAYAAQHIGDQTDRRARQSATVHLIALYLNLGKKIPQGEVLAFIKKATTIKRDWPPQIQRQNPQWLTVQDIAKADSPNSHAQLVMAWGQSVLNAYGDCHDEIVRLYEGLMKQ
jgi:hypothetical protein